MPSQRPATSNQRPKGGRRPGAGAPRGNLNALKSGRYSRQVRALKLALQAVPLTAEVLRRFHAARDGRHQLLARALHHYADLLLLPTLDTALSVPKEPALSVPKGQSTDLQEKSPEQIAVLRKIAKAIKQSDPPAVGAGLCARPHVPLEPPTRNPGVRSRFLP